jgi:hypothetical protein
MINNSGLSDVLDRVGWTFVQALLGTGAAGVTADQVGAADWRALLVGGAVAAVVALLKVAGVKASHLASAKKAVDAAEEIPAVKHLLDGLRGTLSKLDDSQAGAIVAEVLKKAADELATSEPISQNSIFPRR